MSKLIIAVRILAIPILIAVVLTFANKSTKYATARGTFDGTINDINGNEYHLFKSYDNNVWWTLSAEEIGFVPKANKEYVVVYDDKGTTKPCEENCECFAYDDEFIEIRGGN